MYVLFQWNDLNTTVIPLSTYMLARAMTISILLQYQDRFKLRRIIAIIKTGSLYSAIQGIFLA